MATKKDKYLEEQANALYELIMQSDTQWRKEWVSENFLQQNATTQKPYRCGNQISLFQRSIRENIKDPRWLTFNQIQRKGYKLKKGSKSSLIGFYTQQKQILERDKNGKEILDEKGEKIYKKIELYAPVLAVYNVFNAKDIEGIAEFEKSILSQEERNKLQEQRYQQAQAMIDKFCQDNKIPLKEVPSKKAFYAQNIINEKNRFVVIPLKEQYKNLDSYYATVFHEIAHSTQILNIRINKEKDSSLGNTFGSKNYAKEELTAELTSLFLCKEFGFDSSELSNTKENSLAYLKGWIENGQLTKNDFIVAIREAKRAYNTVYNCHLKLDLTQNKEQVAEKQDTNYTFLQKELPHQFKLKDEKGNELFLSELPYKDRLQLLKGQKTTHTYQIYSNKTKQYYKARLQLERKNGQVKLKPIFVNTKAIDYPAYGISQEQINTLQKGNVVKVTNEYKGQHLSSFIKQDMALNMLNQLTAFIFETKIINQIEDKQIQEELKNFNEKQQCEFLQGTKKLKGQENLYSFDFVNEQITTQPIQNSQNINIKKEKSEDITQKLKL